MLERISSWIITERKTRSDAVSEEHRRCAHDFWSSSEVSHPTGNKRDIVRERVGPKEYILHEKHVLRMSQTEAFYELKKQHPEINMGRRTFENCRPFFVFPTRPQDRVSCCCRTHVVTRLLFGACMQFRRKVLVNRTAKGIDSEGISVLNHLTDAVHMTLCNKDGDANYHKLACINREHQMWYGYFSLINKRKGRW